MTPVRAALFAAVGLAVVAYPLMRDRASNETPAERTFLFDLDEISEEEKKEEGHAWEMFEWWHDQRAYPNEQIPASGFFDAWEYARTEVPMDDTQRGLRANTWTSIGPNNVGGRMLAVVVDPNNASRVWAGAASGGLWLSTSAGEGRRRGREWKPGTPRCPCRRSRWIPGTPTIC